MRADGTVVRNIAHKQTTIPQEALIRQEPYKSADSKIADVVTTTPRFVAAWLSFQRVTAQTMRSNKFLHFHILIISNLFHILIISHLYIRTYLIKVTRSSTKGSFLPVNVSIIINSFLEVCKVLATSLQLHILRR